jgi:nucleotide-binding universal stress UspA family protein
MMTFKTILHPTDFSAPSEYAFGLACSLARDHGARLLVLHAIPPTAFEYDALAPHDSPDGYREKLWEDLRRLETIDPHVRELRVKSELVEGLPSEEILRAARDSGCDLIVLGTHGRTGLGRLLLGSVAEEVLRKAPCPVLAVKSPPLDSVTHGGQDEEAVQT